MKSKINKVIAICLLILLVIIAAVCIYGYIGSGSKEKKVAKAYVTMLREKDMIDKDVNLDEIESIKKSDPSKAEEYYSVTVDKYAVDIDAKYNVIGFNNQKSKVDFENISLDNAKDIAENYVKTLYDGECIFKESVKEEESQKVPYYTMIFSKCKDGIPYYTYSVSVKINKESGKLDGFSNSSLNIEPKESIVNISKEKAESNVKEFFCKVNTFVEFDDETCECFYEDKDKRELELCYIVSVRGIDSDNKEIKMKYFVSAETGEIINSEKNNVTSVTA